MSQPMHQGNSQSPISDSQPVPPTAEPNHKDRPNLVDITKEYIRKTTRKNKESLMSLLEQHEVSKI